MFVYWLTGSLRLHPESDEERDALDLLAKTATLRTPPDLERGESDGIKQLCARVGVPKVKGRPIVNPHHKKAVIR
jgi:hypothetical protein